MRNTIFCVGAAMAAMAMAGASPAMAAAVVLTFDGTACTGTDGGAVDRTCTTNGQFIGANYGSTAQLAVSYDASEPNNGATPPRTSLQWNVDGAFTGSGMAYSFPPGPADEPSIITFTPAAGYEVSFTSFSWDAMTRTTSVDFFFRVLAPGGDVLFSAGHATRGYTVNTAYFAGPVTFEFGNGGRGSVGIDQINLDVRATPTAAVPEPGAWALMILGFGAAGSLLRRQRQAMA